MLACPSDRFIDLRFHRGSTQLPTHLELTAARIRASLYRDRSDSFETRGNFFEALEADDWSCDLVCMIEVVLSPLPRGKIRGDFMVRNGPIFRRFISEAWVRSCS